MARSLPLLRSRRARWAVPVAVLALVGVGVGLGATGAVANPGLAPKTAGELLAAVANAPNQPFTGTVVETANLGLPALPDTGGSTSPQALLTGSHTLRIWYASPKQVRLALIGDLAETDLIRNGTDAWLWSSRTNTATHTVLPAGAATAQRSPSTMPIDPVTAAQQALAAIDPTTVVTVDGTSVVAKRPVYELVLKPRDKQSLIAQVRLALDSTTFLPLRVEVYAKGGRSPAFETGFTSLQIHKPASSVFSFRPPPGAKVTGPSAPRTTQSKPSAPSTGAASPTTVGTGWMSVLVLHGATASSLGSNATLGTLLKATKPVHGAYGRGQLLSTPLLSVLMLSDGRTLVGAVQPRVLEQAATAATATAAS
jgi:outer membrane lipoprotein-sorting protein